MATDNFNGFPLDSSQTTRLKYDILAERISTGLDNHHRRNNNSTSLLELTILFSAIIKITIAVLVILFTVTKGTINWIGGKKK